MSTESLLVRYPGRVDYRDAWQQMIDFTRSRDDQAPDECWQVEHPPVFTLGLAGREEHILDRGNIPVVHSDRGGQVTYHGPGQLVVYIMLDLKRRGMTVRRYVQALEQVLIDYLATQDIPATRRDKAPGVYVDGQKIAALGIRIKHGCTYHGIALNVDMDLAPFSRIHPCGYADLEVTSMARKGVLLNTTTVFDGLIPVLVNELGYDIVNTSRIDRAGQTQAA